MKRLAVLMMLLSLLSAAGVSAQNAPPAQADQARPTDPINIRYEIRLVEDGGGRKPSTKVVTMIGTLNEVSIVRGSGGPGERNPLFVDITPTILRDSKVRTKIGIEFRPEPPPPVNNIAANPFIVRQTVHAWLDSGKPMNISQSVDPTTDRRITVDVTATIVR